MKFEQGQFDLTSVYTDKAVVENRKNRTQWRKGMQAYINKQQQSKRAETTGWCVCGNMTYCDYCNDSTKNTACVNSIIEQAKEQGIAIDYSRKDYEKQLEEIEKQ